MEWVFVRVDEVRGRFPRNGRLSLFLLPAACSVDIITVHVSLTAADWLEGRDQGKVTDVKLNTMITRVPLTTCTRKHLCKNATFAFVIFASFTHAQRCIIIYSVMSQNVFVCFMQLKVIYSKTWLFACFYFACLTTKLPVQFSFFRSLTQGGGHFVPHIVLF